MPIDYTTIEVAQELGVSPITIRSSIYRKQLTAQQRGRDWFIISTCVRGIGASALLMKDIKRYTLAASFGSLYVDRRVHHSRRGTGRLGCA